MKRVLVYLADGFEECEALLVVDILRRAGIDVVTVSITGNPVVTSTHRVCIYADALLAETNVGLFDAIVLPGGIPGTPNLAACEEVTMACAQFAAAGKLVAAICAAPSILGKLGLLEGKKATVYPGMEETLTGAEPVSAETVREGAIITGQAMGAAIPFALTVVDALLGGDVAKNLASDICYRHF